MPVEEKNIATELLQLLGYLPLAIDQAGAHISVQMRSFSGSAARFQTQALQSYLDAYKDNAKIFLLRKPPCSTWGYRNDTVFTTWEVSFATIRDQNPDAANLLLLCGFLAKSDIFEEMLRYSRILPADSKSILDFKIFDDGSLTFCSERFATTTSNSPTVFLLTCELQRLC
jgi:hypothetical protein